MPVAERPVNIVLPQIHPEPMLILKGLPEGSNPVDVRKCIGLVEHAAICGSQSGSCPQGEGCRRTRQVLAHHFSCKKMKMGEENDCNICRQLLALCRNHSNHCQASDGNCAVPYCKNKSKKLKTVSNPNQIRSNTANEDRTRKEYEHVIKKLSEAMELPTKQQKLQGIERLLETNRQATVQVLRYILGKKHKSQPVSLSHQMKNLSIGKKGKLTVENCRQRALDPAVWPPALTCILKLVVKAPLIPIT